jgi:hypothetical protein
MPAQQPPAADASVSTNAAKKGITAEDRKKILDLAEQARSAQTKALDTIKNKDIPASMVQQRLAHDLLKEIEDLLPKDSQNQQQQNEQENQQDQQQEQQNQQQQDKPKDNQQTDKQEQKQPQEKEEEKKDQTPEDVQKLLEKALQREKEHEAEKRQRRDYAQPIPSERDW